MKKTLLTALVLSSLVAMPVMAKESDSGKGRDRVESPRQSFEDLTKNEHVWHGDSKQWEYTAQEGHHMYEDHVPSVPEPESFLMLLAGLAMVGVVARKKVQLKN